MLLTTNAPIECTCDTICRCPRTPFSISELPRTRDLLSKHIHKMTAELALTPLRQRKQTAFLKDRIATTQLTLARITEALEQMRQVAA